MLWNFGHCCEWGLFCIVFYGSPCHRNDTNGSIYISKMWLTRVILRLMYSCNCSKYVCNWYMVYIFIFTVCSLLPVQKWPSWWEKKMSSICANRKDKDHAAQSRKILEAWLWISLIQAANNKGAAKTVQANLRLCCSHMWYMRFSSRWDSNDVCSIWVNNLTGQLENLAGIL